MQERIKIKHDGPRGWAGIVKSAFDPAKHEPFGGSGQRDAPAAVAGDDMAALRAEYQRVMGKRPFPGWDADTLRAKMGNE